jgi:predicted permease
MWSPQLLEDFFQDVRQGLRQMRRSPGFAAVAALTLALALGANAAVFGVLEGVLLRPLPYALPDRLVAIWDRFLPESGYDAPKATLTGPDVLDLQAATATLSSVGIIQGGASVALSGDGADAQEVPVWLGSASLLPTLGVDPLLGRWFTSDEDVPGGAAVAVITHALWSERYGSDPQIVGRVVTMSGAPTEVVGVLPAGFTLGLWSREVGAYLPLRLTPGNTRSGHAYGAVGRLAAGYEMADVDAELGVLNERWRQERSRSGVEVWALPLTEDRLDQAAEPVVLLTVAVGLVLLVACVNVAGLLLARGERRQDEMCLRTALGASRWRVIRQLLTESLVLAGGGLLLAIPLAWLGTEAVIDLDPTALPRLGDVAVGRGALGVTATGTALATLLFGLAPALVMLRQAGPASGAARASTSGRAAGRLRRLLVTTEVAVSLTVVIVAGLLVRSFWERASADPGFRTDRLLAFDLTLSPERYQADERVPIAYQNVLDRLGWLPGVRSVSAASAVPFGEHMLVFPFRLDGRPPRREDEPAWSAITNFVMPGYFTTMGIHLEEGRGLTDADGAGAPAVAVVNETMARTFWPGERAVGKRWTYFPEGSDGPWVTVVGVVPDQLRSAVGEEAFPQVYLPQFQSEHVIRRTARSATVVVRTVVDPLSLAPAIRAAVRELDAGLPVGNLRLMTDTFSRSMARPRLIAYLLGIFAAITLVMALVGLYGVVSYAAAGRTREIGVRVALGATRARVLRMTLREGSAPLALGVLLGSAAGWYATRFVGDLLYRVSAADPTTFVTGALAFLTVGMGATLLPALRATTIAPTEALREE